MPLYTTPQYGVIKHAGGDYFSRSPNETFVASPEISGKHDDDDEPFEEKEEDELLSQANGLIRLRENTGSVTPTQSKVHRKSCREIARFTEESLHSFGFTQPFRDQNTFDTRRNVVNRSFDFMKKLRDRLENGKLEECPVSDEIGELPDMKRPAFERSSSPRARRTQTAFDPIDTQHALDVILTNRRNSIDTDLMPLTARPGQSQALHPPTRFLPQNQCIVTTNESGKILLFNDIASLCFGYDKSYVGQSLLNVFEESSKERLQHLLNTRSSEMKGISTEHHDRGNVLICGKVLPIIKRNGSKSAASLWLKQKKDVTGAPIYIWIFEEIAESLVSMIVTSTGVIKEVNGAVNDLYGYSADALIGKRIETLIPDCSNLRLTDSGYHDSTEKDAPLNLSELNKYKFYGSCTSFGAKFPVIVKSKVSTSPTSPNGMAMHHIKVISIPTIAGLVTIHQDGLIQSINSVPAKYLFGYSQEDLIEKKNISELLPQLPTILKGLEKEIITKCSNIIDHFTCRKILLEREQSSRITKVGSTGQFNIPHTRTLTTTSQEKPLPVIQAVHRDGTWFEIQLQLRIMDMTEGELIAVWIMFDRVSTFSKYGHKSKVGSNNQQFGSSVSNFPAVKLRSSISTPSESPLVLKSPIAAPKASPPSPPHPSMVHRNSTPPSPPSTTPPIIRPQLKSFGVSSFGSPQVDRKVVPLNEPMPSSVQPTPPVNKLPSVAATLLRLPSNVHPNTPPPSRTPPVSMLNYSALTLKTNISDYCIMDSLGQGAYGMVKLAYKLDDPEKNKVVIKYVVKSRILVDSWIRDRHLRMVPLEIHILHTLQRIPHINCCHMLDYFEDEDYYYIVMDLHGEGLDLFDYIELNREMSEHEIKSIFRQIGEAIRHLHHNKMVHRDIKDENVILDENGTALLIDFGSANYVKEGKRFDTFSGTLDYCAPEVLQGNPYEGPPQDIWSLGILLYTMIYKENPFYNIDEILARELRIPFEFCEGSIDLIKSMLNRDVEKRPTIDGVLNHPWLS
ncbi:hypothetical protein K450DRAFT_249597 [Umbelopsis ramanniana AG]|uniref:non-specific serine/threonine protein kinase n=1 Tax=Umbelopsis ramanniana AG TaxID=1314678 RepID=A0AAD5E5J3_UMBRA|nr:uncharacterized protein K450DRAFT_249597 [Umbelopsis ramanniana AG]KAI8577858.1 hypothetical protein K450DRAFT_249597 [Umbelopsis ramanniana AG]